MADYGVEEGIPTIPDIEANEADAVLRALKEWVEIRQGDGGDPLDRAVTVRDLMNAGIAAETAAAIITHGEYHPHVPSEITQPAIPPTPTHLTVAGAVQTMVITWVFPMEYTRLSHFELWRSPTDNIADAVLHAQTKAMIYADEVGTGASYYYWVRAVSDGGTSPFSKLEGVHGATAIDVDQVIDAIDDALDMSGLLDQLTIKVSNDGYVSGYGLANTPSQGGTSTAFAILANRFLVAAPAVDGISPAVPFTIQTTPTTENGVTVPPGVYMSNVFIRNGSITTAKIANASIDDAKIASLSASKIIAGEMHGDRIQANTLNANRIITSTLSARLATITNAYVNSANIVNASVTTAKIADLNVTSAKIANLAVTNAKIGNLQVTAAKIADLNVTTAKIAGNAVSTTAFIEGHSSASVTVMTGDVVVLTASGIAGYRTMFEGLALLTNDSRVFTGIIYENIWSTRSKALYVTSAPANGQVFTFYTEAGSTSPYLQGTCMITLFRR